MPGKLLKVIVESASTVYLIQPDEAFATARMVWMPIGSGSTQAALWYLKRHGDHVGWYAAENVIGLLASPQPEYRSVEGVRYVGYRLNHAGAVQLR